MGRRTDRMACRTGISFLIFLPAARLVSQPIRSANSEATRQNVHLRTANTRLDSAPAMPKTNPAVPKTNPAVPTKQERSWPWRLQRWAFRRHYNSFTENLTFKQGIVPTGRLEICPSTEDLPRFCRVYSGHNANSAVRSGYCFAMNRSLL